MIKATQLNGTTKQDPIETIIETILSGSVNDLETYARNRKIPYDIRLPLRKLLNGKIEPTEAVEEVRAYEKTRIVEIREMEDGSRGWVYVR